MTSAERNGENKPGAGFRAAGFGKHSHTDRRVGEPILLHAIGDRGPAFCLGPGSTDLVAVKDDQIAQLGEARIRDFGRRQIGRFDRKRKARKMRLQASTCQSCAALRAVQCHPSLCERGARQIDIQSSRIAQVHPPGYGGKRLLVIRHCRAIDFRPRGCGQPIEPLFGKKKRGLVASILREVAGGRDAMFADFAIEPCLSRQSKCARHLSIVFIELAADIDATAGVAARQGDFMWPPAQARGPRACRFEAGASGDDRGMIVEHLLYRRFVGQTSFGREGRDQQECGRHGRDRAHSSPPPTAMHRSPRVRLRFLQTARKGSAGE